jgi:hypothetical protein
MSDIADLMIVELKNSTLFGSRVVKGPPVTMHQVPCAGVQLNRTNELQGDGKGLGVYEYGLTIWAVCKESDNLAQEQAVELAILTAIRTQLRALSSMDVRYIDDGTVRITAEC